MSDPWFKFYASDWLAGTRGLTAAETGVYVTLIAMMYERGESIPRDDARLSRLCGCPKASFTRSLNALIDEGKVTDTDGGLSNSRVEKERQCRAEKSQKASVSASKRWASQADKTERNQQKTDANAVKSQCELDANQNQIPEPEKKDTIVSQKNGTDLFDDPPPKPKPGPKPKPKRASEIPENWVPSDKNISDALSKNLSHQQITDEGEKFRDHHTARGTTFKNWDAAWRTWVSNALKFGAVRGPASQRRGMAGRDVAEEITTDAIRLASKAEAHGPDWGSA